MIRETAVRRYYGSETEYGYRLKKGQVGPITEQKTPPGIVHIGQYLENGGRLYQDVGQLEYATPECEKLDDLIKHELAGEEMIWEAYGNSRSKAETIHKRCISPDGLYSSGAHENYSTAIDIWNGPNMEEQRDNLATHFATRSMYIGAGQQTNDGFALAQKIQDLSELTGQNALRSKALVNTRNEPHAGGSKLHRLHVVCGDPNLSPWAIRMKYATTSLELRLLEHGYNNDLILQDPLKASKLVAKGIEGISTPLRLRSGKTATAVELQLARAEQAAMLSELIELPEQERAMIPEWFQILDALKKYSKTGESEAPMEQIDWFAKLSLINGYKEKKGEISTSRAMQLDLLYDQVPNGLHKSLRKGVFAPAMPSKTQIQEAKTTAPSGGRAQLRGELIKSLAQRTEASGNKPYNTISWDQYHDGKKASSLGPIEAHYTTEEITEKVLVLTSSNL